MIRPTKRFAIVNAKSVQRLIYDDMQGCVAVVRDAYLAHNAGQTVNPQSVFLRFPDRPNARIIGLPAHFRGPNGISGLKWIASYPDNVANGIARASAVLILNEVDTGYPMACIEGSIISASRTAASAVLAAEWIRLRKKNIRTLGIVGAGLISRYVLKFFLGTGWEIGMVRLHDTNPVAAESLKSWLSSQVQCKVVVDSGVDAVVSGSDVVLFATVAGKPHVHNPECLARCPTVLHLSLRDLATELIVASTNVVDDREHVLTAGTSLALSAEAHGHSNFINGTLADLLLERIVLPDNRATVFSPFGLGMLDLAVGRWIYERAEQSRELTFVDDFFDAQPA